MGFDTKRLFPRSGDYLGEGLRLLLINGLIFLLVGGGSFLLFNGVLKARQSGFPLPFPLWLILLGAGIPCFIFWFNYGKTFGSFINKRRLTGGLAIGLLGDVPGLIILYIVLTRNPKPVDFELFRIMMIMLFMAIFMIPILVVLGTLDQKD